jgi:hypothetical protein
MSRHVGTPRPIVTTHGRDLCAVVYERRSFNRVALQLIFNASGASAASRYMIAFMARPIQHEACNEAFG